MTTAPPEPNVTCPVCKARPGKPCRDLTFMLLPGSHVERTETTPLADLSAFTVAMNTAVTEAILSELQPDTGPSA